MITINAENIDLENWVFPGKWSVLKRLEQFCQAAAKAGAEALLESFNEPPHGPLAYLSDDRPPIGPSLHLSLGDLGVCIPLSDLLDTERNQFDHPEEVAKALRAIADQIDPPDQATIA